MYGSNSGSCILCVRVLRYDSDGHIESGDGPLNSVDGPQVMFACPLNPHFAHSATHCVGWVTGINRDRKLACRKGAYHERVALKPHIRHQRVYGMGDKQLYVDPCDSSHRMCCRMRKMWVQRASEHGLGSIVQTVPNSTWPSQLHWSIHVHTHEMYEPESPNYFTAEAPSNPLLNLPRNKQNSLCFKVRPKNWQFQVFIPGWIIGGRQLCYHGNWIKFTWWCCPRAPADHCLVPGVVGHLHCQNLRIKFWTKCCLFVFFTQEILLEWPL